MTSGYLITGERVPPEQRIITQEFGNSKLKEPVISEVSSQDTMDTSSDEYESDKESAVRPASTAALVPSADIPSVSDDAPPWEITPSDLYSVSMDAAGAESIVDKTIDTSTFFGKILANMRPIQRGIYKSKVTQTENPVTFVDLIRIMNEAYEKFGSVNAEIKPSFYLCMYTKFCRLIEKYGMTDEDGYEIYWDTLHQGGYDNGFIDRLSETWNKLIIHVQFDRPDESRFLFEVKTLIKNLRRI